MSSAAINVRFFQSVFEQNPGFGWHHLIKVILKCIVSVKETKKPKSTSGADDELMPSKGETSKGKKGVDEDDGLGSRSNH